MAVHLQITPFNIKEAGDHEYAAMNRHVNRIRQERLPDDPPIPLEETIQEFQNIPPFLDLKMWCAWEPDGSEIAARGHVLLMRLEDNKHLAQFDINVRSEYRRQGLGRRLLALITDTAREDHRQLLLTDTYDRIPAGEAFMDHIGAQKGLETHMNQLRTADLDRTMMELWLARGISHNDMFEIGFWEGPYPEDQLDAVTQLFDLTNQQPFGELNIEDQHTTPEQIRQIEKMLFARGNQRWTCYIREKITGQFAGYTETVWNPNRPEILRQDMTGVFPEYRNKGLGRWLKAAMMEKVLKERPQVKFVRTGNADSNAAMLKINQEMGFQPYMAETIWQVEIDRVQEYLKTSLHRGV